jgi:hypothetical protein
MTASQRVELHCHLDGVPDCAMLADCERAGVRLALTAAELGRVGPVVDIASFQRWFEVAEALEGSLAGYEPIVARHVERLVEQGVVHAEARGACASSCCSRSAAPVRPRACRPCARACCRGSRNG